MIVTSQTSVSDREAVSKPVSVEVTPAAFAVGSARQHTRGHWFDYWDANHNGRRQN
jgi:hypothetical protein